MFHLLFLIILSGSPAAGAPAVGLSGALEDCAPKRYLGESGIWDGHRFVRAANDEFSVSDDGFFWQALGVFPVVSNGYPTYDLQSNGAVYLWSHSRGSFVSRDLVQWTELPVAALSKFVWNGSYWLAYANNRFGVSSDGYQWTFAPEGNVYLSNVVFFKGQFLSTGIPLRTSSDGLNWEDQAFDVSALYAFENQILAVSGQQGWLSDDGRTWQATDFGPGSNPTSVAYNGTIFVARGSQNLFTSTDGLNWSPQSLPENMGQVFWDGHYFYTTDVVYRSSDGTHWEELVFYGRQPVFNGNGTVYFDEGYVQGGVAYRYIAYGEFQEVHGLYFAKEGSLAVSADAVGFRTLPFYADEVFYVGDRWECFDEQLLRYSYDGFTWSSEPSPELSSTAFVAHGRYFNGNRTSSDGVNWVDMNSSLTTAIWTGNGYLGLSSLGYVRSTDGVQWSAIALPFHPDLGNVIVKNGVLVGNSGGQIYVSLDEGRNWFIAHSKINDVSAIGIYQSKILAFSALGNVYSSDDGLSWSWQKIGVLFRNLVLAGPDRILFSDGFQRFSLECVGGESIEEEAVAVFPWVVANQTWFSRLGLMNPQRSAARVVLEAEDRQGNKQTFVTIIPANGLFTALAAELFPGLNGYSVTLTTSDKTLSAALTTFNENPQVGTRSPAQADASLVGELSDELLFAYLPGEDVPAVVLENMAPHAGEIEVVFSLMDAQGAVIAEVAQRLISKRPFASTVADLFPGVTLPVSGAVRAKGPEDAWLAGLTFDFNRQGMPAMDRAFSIH